MGRGRLPPRCSEAERFDEPRLELCFFALVVEFSLLQLLLEFISCQLVHGGHIHIAVAARRLRRGLLLGDGLGLALLAAAARLLALLGALGGLRLGLVEVGDRGARGLGVLLESRRLALELGERRGLRIGPLARGRGFPRRGLGGDLCFGLCSSSGLCFFGCLGDRRLLILRLLDGDSSDEALRLRLCFGFLGSSRFGGGLGFSFCFRDGRGALLRLFFGFLPRLRRDR